MDMNRSLNVFKKGSLLFFLVVILFSYSLGVSARQNTNSLRSPQSSLSTQQSVSLNFKKEIKANFLKSFIPSEFLSNHSKKRFSKGDENHQFSGSFLQVDHLSNLNLDFLTIHSQVEVADAIVIGHYLDQKLVIHDDSEILQISLKLNKEFGLNPTLAGFGEILINFKKPKKLSELEESVINRGTQFIPGEKLAIILKVVEGRFWPVYGALSLYRVINFGDKKMLINSVFKDKTLVTQMESMVFENKVQRIKNFSMKKIENHFSEERLPKDHLAQDHSLKEDFSQELFLSGKNLSRGPASINYLQRTNAFVDEGKNEHFLLKKNKLHDKNGGWSEISFLSLLLCMFLMVLLHKSLMRGHLKSFKHKD